MELPIHRLESSKEDQNGGRKVPQFITYGCQRCCKLDLQVSICLKALVSYMNKYEGGYTDAMDDLDPIIKRLYLERGYEEHRKRPLTSSKSPNRKQSKKELQISTDKQNPNQFSVAK